MHVSRRSETMPESPIRKLVPYADEAKKRGIKIYHLNIGQPDIKTPECALEAIRKVDRKILEYSPSQGYLGLRKRMAEYYRKFNVKVSEDEIIVTTGGSEAISMTLNTCLDNGDEMIVTEPSYANYISLAAQNGVAIRAVKTHIEDGFKLPPVERFEDLITERTKAILLCNPNNPTGYVYSTEEMNILRDMAKKHDLFLIVDEVYREFTYTGVPYFSSLRLKGVDENVIVIDSGRDLCVDFNDNREADRLVAHFKQIATDLNAVVITTSHKSLGNGNAKGHFGMRLNEAAGLELSLKKDKEVEDTFVNVELPKQREDQYEPFSFRLDPEVGMLVEYTPTVDHKEEKRQFRMARETVMKILRPGETIRYNDLVYKLSNNVAQIGGKNVSERTAKNYVKVLTGTVLTISEDGAYRLADPNLEIQYEGG